MLLSSLNSCVNPWIYLLFNRDLLVVLREAVCCCACFGRYAPCSGHCGRPAGGHTSVKGIGKRGGPIGRPTRGVGGPSSVGGGSIYSRGERIAGHNLRVDWNLVGGHPTAATEVTEPKQSSRPALRLDKSPIQRLRTLSDGSTSGGGDPTLRYSSAASVARQGSIAEETEADCRPKSGEEELPRGGSEESTPVGRIIQNPMGPNS